MHLVIGSITFFSILIYRFIKARLARMAGNIPIKLTNTTSFKNAPLEGVVRMELVVFTMSRMLGNCNYSI